VIDLAVILLSFLASLALTGWYRKALTRQNRLDRPNERSMHAVPVPRGGGGALLLVLIPGMIIAGLRLDGLATHATLVAGTVSLALISRIDDARGVSAKLRLSIHLLAALFGTLALPPHATLFGDTLPFALDRAVMIVGWAWFMNLYNFMDGIDGITGVETVSLATGICLVMGAIGLNDPFLSTLTLLLTGVSLGFLAFNWHPAKIFLGDVGSVPLGFLTGFGLLSLAAHGHLVAALILPLYYLADSGITITKRALRGEKIWQAHRQHFYQRAALGAGRHDTVVLRIALANAALIGASLLAVFHPLTGLAIGAAVVAFLLWNMQKRSRVV